MSMSVDAALAGEIFDHFCNAGTLKSILRSYRLQQSSSSLMCSAIQQDFPVRMLSDNIKGTHIYESEATHMSQKEGTGGALSIC